MSNYTLAIPMMLDDDRAEKYLPERLRRARLAGAQRVFLCPSNAAASEASKQEQLEKLRRMAPQVTAAGFELGIWFNALGHGYDGLAAGTEESPEGLTYMKDLDGNVDPGSTCPMDPKVIALMCDWAQRLATACEGVRIVQLDDDYRMGYRPGGPYCCCKHHTAALQAAISRRTGQPVRPFDAAEMKQALTTGGPNPLRDAWLEVQGNGLNDLAKAMRAALDQVAPTVRLTACACLPTWDVDGVDSLTLAKSFAGATRPLLRLIGAPYWAAIGAMGNIRLGNVCEYERMQQQWAAGSGVEIFCEGDIYPRPRYTSPAAYLEGFDQVMRAAGTSQGILKYMFEYGSSPEYETGYYDRHMRNRGLYRAIHRAFDGKKAVGTKVFEPMNTYALSHDPGSLADRCLPPSLRFVSDNNLAVRYDTAGQDATVIFDDAAELAGPEQLAHGAILDAHAARILTRRGFDVGLAAIGEELHPAGEYYPEKDELVDISGGSYLALTPADDARILSSLQLKDGSRKLPGAYLYQNAEGQRFLVYAFIARKCNQQGAQLGMLRGWCRAAQLRAQLAWLAGRQPDAVCSPSPDLYMLAKRDARSLTVGLWNFCVDAAFCPQVQLGEDWPTLLPVVGGSLKNGRTVTLDDIPPFGFACFTVTLDEAPIQPEPDKEEPKSRPTLKEGIRKTLKTGVKKVLKTIR